MRRYCHQADRVLAKLSHLPINIIMTDRILDSLFRHIHEFSELGDHLTADDVNGLFGEVRKLVPLLKQCANSGAFPAQEGATHNGIKARLFVNNILEVSNLLLFNNGHVFSAFDLNSVPGFISIYRPASDFFVKEWLDFLTHHATPITMSNEKERKGFFKKLEYRIDLEEKKMLAVVG